MTMFGFIRDSINSDSPEKDIPRHISEMSIIYQLFAGRSDIDIYASVKNGRIGFSILHEKEDDAIALEQKLNGSHYTAYGITYRLKAKTNKNSVYITLVQ